MTYYHFPREKTTPRRAVETGTLAFHPAAVMDGKRICRRNTMTFSAVTSCVMVISPLLDRPR